jgi:hypothetical protein
MKNLALFLAFALPALATQAQLIRFYYPDAFYFVKEVPVAQQQDKSFHFDISVKENPADSLSRTRIYAIQVRKGKEDIIGKTLIYANAAGDSWKKYSIDGIIDAEATRIRLYVAVNGNGDFYFDNLHFFLAGTAGVLQEKPLANASFEEKKLLSGYYVSKRFAPDFKLQASPVAVDGKQSVQVTTSGQKPSMYTNRNFAAN